MDGSFDHVARLADAIELPIGRWDGELRLSFCNQPYVAWSGLDREQLIGRTMAEIFGDAAWAAASDAFTRALAGETVRYERQLTHQGGPSRWARILAFPDRNKEGRVEAIYTIAVDIHLDVLAREQLEASRRRLDRFTENIPYPLTYVDREFKLLFVNKAYQQITGMDAAQLLGRPIGEVRGPKRWEEHRPYFERALAGESVQYTRLVRLSEHEQRWMRTSYVPDLDANGEVVGLYTVSIDVHELSQAREQLQRSVEEDTLTGVLSRGAVLARLESRLPHASRAAPLALFFVDLDGFKAVNDSLGHRAGDQLLVATAAALQSAVRADDVVGRYGGDEFLVLASVRDEAGAHALASHLRAAVRRCGAGVAGEPSVSASIGYALAPDDALESVRLIQRADDAMYAAKRLGRDRAFHCAEAEPLKRG
ncbi:sensor domain-containing diguanylate cyclase [Rivibacter subsaxonicus]|uniref:PAS domain S-box-containing protein/diguanylate cyclase (GGDEF)-like protein n=1 Tax=Rivibacter subsaxonicus TaxID=457575 RepID=A0A4Q7VA94_9BURK|nr:diguanylate cyclase [Rivibacter subsaxonicus]RZT93686.1 PAS domain S-box-containing protein/diguanylate cyclase (GGDEF)-like protein [Rivibacter subsaxonicus]